MGVSQKTQVLGCFYWHIHPTLTTQKEDSPYGSGCHCNHNCQFRITATLGWLFVKTTRKAVLLATHQDSPPLNRTVGLLMILALKKCPGVGNRNEFKTEPTC